MAEFSSTVVAPVRRYHPYMDQWEAETDAAFFFERELSKNDIIKGVRVCICCFIDSIRPLFAEQVMLSLLIGTASATQ